METFVWGAHLESGFLSSSLAGVPFCLRHCKGDAGWEWAVLHWMRSKIHYVLVDICCDSYKLLLQNQLHLVLFLMDSYPHFPKCFVVVAAAAGQRRDSSRRQISSEAVTIAELGLWLFTTVASLMAPFTFRKFILSQQSFKTRASLFQLSMQLKLCFFRRRPWPDATLHSWQAQLVVLWSEWCDGLSC